VNNWIPFLTRLVDQTDPIALHYFQTTTLQTRLKQDNTIVSEADLAVETRVREIIQAEMPELNVLGEEYGGMENSKELRLIIDPIDGTKNFVAGNPFFATLLGIEEHGEVIAGLISAPATRDRWWAAKGQGAFHNGKVIQVSQIKDLTKATAFHSSLFPPKMNDKNQGMFPLLAQTLYQRGYGDYLAPMLVAEGCGEFSLDFNIKPWDMAAIKIIIEEAGGKFSDVQGVNTIYSNNMVVSNGLFHEQIVSYMSICE